MNILVVNGPNLNLLGERNRDIYGENTLEELMMWLETSAGGKKHSFKFYQSNHEGDIVDAIQESLNENVDGIIINPAAFTHYSIAIRDAIRAVNLPTIEVHISNIAAREEFRKKSLISDVVAGTITGFGPYSYHLALIAMIQILNEIKMAKEAQAKAAQANN